MHTISRDAPCFTSVAKDRLAVFRTDEIKLVTCGALDEARRSGKFALYAYAIMPDHLLVITNSALSRNPVRAGLVSHPEEYRWSSVRCWSKKLLEDEPLLMDIDQISWRRS